MYIEEKGSSKPKIRLKKRTAAAGATGSGSSSTRGILPPSAPSSECGNNPLNRLCLKLLDWDICNTKNTSLREGQALPTLPMTFEHYRAYVNAWEPLLVEEIRANILSTCPVSSFEKNTSICSIQMPSDLETSMNPLVTVQGSMVQESTTASRTGRPSPPTHMDIVLLTEVVAPISSGNKLNSNLSKAKQPRAQSNNNTIINISRNVPLPAPPPFEPPPPPPAAPNTDRKCFLAIVSAQSHGIELTFTLHRQRVVHSRKNTTNVKFSVSQYNCKVLSSLTSSWREFLALHEAHRMPLLPYILCPSMSTSTPTSDTAVAEVTMKSEESKSSDKQTQWLMEGVGEAFNAYIHANFNSSQRRAVQCAVQRSQGFSLIQGPPGTGMLNALHVRDYNRYFEALLGVALGEGGLQCRRLSAGKNSVNGAVSDLTSWSNLVNSLSSKGIKPHLLVVAPSNVAVNNIIEKIMEKGFKDSSGSTYFPYILRIGSGKSRETNSSGSCSNKPTAKSVSLEEAVETLLREEIDENIQFLKRHLQGSHPLNRGWELRVSFENAQPYWVDHSNKCTSPRPPPFSQEQKLAFLSFDTLPEYKQYAHRFVQLLEQLRVNFLRHARLKAIIQHRAQFGTRQMATLRQTLEASFIDEADIIFSTLNSAGHACLEGSCFPVVICDEAAQCVEMSTLIPLRHGAIQCVMVGDHKQLNATTFSKAAAQKGLDISLFERLQIAMDEDRFNGKVVDGAVMLNTQYRMLPEICRFPSKTFYWNELADGENVKAPFYAPSFLLTGSEGSVIKNDTAIYLKPFMFFNLLQSKECLVSSSSSYSNKQEALLCVNIVQQVISESLRMQCKVGSIGIITPYQEQLSELRSCFQQSTRGSQSNKSVSSAFIDPPFLEDGELNETCVSNFPSSCADLSEYDIEMNTVDAFQGREKDIIIFSCVRANNEGSIGFLSDKRRMNVALTRARFGLYVIGHADTLRQNHIWNNLIIHATEQNSFVTLSTATDNLRRQSTSNRGEMQSSTVAILPSDEHDEKTISGKNKNKRKVSEESMNCGQNQDQNQHKKNKVI